MQHYALDDVLSIPVNAASPARGDLLFVSGKSITDKGIQAVTNSPWSHVAIFYDSELVVEAVPTGVRLWPFAQYLVADNALAVAAVNGLFPDAAVEMALSQLGDPYDFSEIAEILARTLTGQAPKAGTKSWICSELTAAAMASGSVSVSLGASGFITPEDVWLCPFVQMLSRPR